eukprot:1216862-Pyramimonas_sp.AAC.1
MSGPRYSRLMCTTGWVRSLVDYFWRVSWDPREAILGRFWDLSGLDGGTLSSKTAPERVRKASIRFSSLEASGSPGMPQSVWGKGSWELCGA